MGAVDRRFPERGATLVEFALILPVLVSLILGLFSGGIAYHRKLTITNGAREAGRFAATLPVDDENDATSPVADMEVWLDSVRDVATGASSGELDAGDDGQYVCVAYVYPEGTAEDDRTTRHITVLGVTGSVEPGKSCIDNDGDGDPDTGSDPDDGRPATERRVQVRAGRDSTLELLLVSWDLTLRSNAITRYERAPT